MFDRPRTGERAILVHVDLPEYEEHEDRGEFEDLVASAGGQAVQCLTASRRSPDPRFFVGQGKAEEIRAHVRATCADLVIVNHALSPAQERNLEACVECRVLDRIALILDIFAQRASSFEGKLQVELAQLRHLSTRLVRGWTHLERQKGGIGLRGPGEKQLESDRRLVTERIRHINRRLQGVERRRDMSRRARQRASIPLVSIVGYTNAGKSTLFNRLTGAGVVTADQLFATLDPTLRRLELPGGVPVIVADTVGFIRHLPHDLVAAFRATLEETRKASLLLHVIDAHATDRRAKVEQVNEVLREIGAHEVPQIEVYNKIDAMDSNDGSGRERPRSTRMSRVRISALTGEGLDDLRRAVADFFHEVTVRRRIRLALGAGRLRARFFELADVVGEHPGKDGEWIMDVEIRPAHLEQLCRSEGLDRSCIAG